MNNDTFCRNCGNQFHHLNAEWTKQGTGEASFIDVCPVCGSDNLTDIIHLSDGVIEIVEPELENEYIRTENFVSILSTNTNLLTL